MWLTTFSAKGDSDSVLEIFSIFIDTSIIGLVIECSPTILRSLVSYMYRNIDHCLGLSIIHVSQYRSLISIIDQRPIIDHYILSINNLSLSDLKPMSSYR